MNRDETVKELQKMKALLATNEELEKSLSEHKVRLQNLICNCTNAVEMFDKKHKETYIVKEIGEAPKKPKLILAPIVPVYVIKRRAYLKQMQEYDLNFKNAEKEYYERYDSIRKELKEKAEIARFKELHNLQALCKNEEKMINDTKQSIEENDLLSAKLKQKEIIEKLLEYFADRRVDTLKEAVNLWFDEKRKDEEAQKLEEHRAAMLLLEEERVRAAQAAEELAYEARRIAQETHERTLSNETYNSYDFTNEYNDFGDDI